MSGGTVNLIARVGSSISINGVETFDLATYTDNVDIVTSQQLTYGTGNYQFNFEYHKQYSWTNDTGLVIDVWDLVDTRGINFKFTRLKYSLVKWIASDVAGEDADLILTSGVGITLPWYADNEVLPVSGDSEHKHYTSGYTVANQNRFINVSFDPGATGDATFDIVLLGIGEEIPT